MSASLKSTYVISMALSNLEAVGRLYQELYKVHELAQKGTEFDVRLGSLPTSRMRDAVAKAVREGAARGWRDAAKAVGANPEQLSFDFGGSGSGGSSSSAPIATLTKSINALQVAVVQLANALRARPASVSGGAPAPDVEQYLPGASGRPPVNYKKKAEFRSALLQAKDARTRLRMIDKLAGDPDKLSFQEMRDLMRDTMLAIPRDQRKPYADAERGLREMRNKLREYRRALKGVGSDEAARGPLMAIYERAAREYTKALQEAFGAHRAALGDMSPYREKWTQISAGAKGKMTQVRERTERDNAFRSAAAAPIKALADEIARLTVVMNRLAKAIKGGIPATGSKPPAATAPTSAGEGIAFAEAAPPPETGPRPYINYKKTEAFKELFAKAKSARDRQRAARLLEKEEVTQLPNPVLREILEASVGLVPIEKRAGLRAQNQRLSENYAALAVLQRKLNALEADDPRRAELQATVDAGAADYTQRLRGAVTQRRAAVGDTALIQERLQQERNAATQEMMLQSERFNGMPMAVPKPKVFADSPKWVLEKQEEEALANTMLAARAMQDLNQKGKTRFEQEPITANRAGRILEGSVGLLPAIQRPDALKANAEIFKILESDDAGRFAKFVGAVRSVIRQRAIPLKDALPEIAERAAERFQNSRQNILTTEANLREQGYVERAPVAAAPVAPAELSVKELISRLANVLAAIPALQSAPGAPRVGLPERDDFLQDSAKEAKNKALYEAEPFPTVGPLELVKTEEGQRQYEYLQSRGTKFAPFTPSALGRQQWILSQLTDEYTAGGVTDKDTGVFNKFDERQLEFRAERIAETVDRITRGGEYYRGKRRNVVNGFYVSDKELDKIAEDPTYKERLRPAPAAPVAEEYRKFVADRRQAKEATELAGAMERIAKVDLDPIRLAFKSLTDAIVPLKANLVGISELLGKAVGAQLKLDYDKKLKDQRLAFERELAAIKGISVEDPVAAAQRRLTQDFALGRGVGIAVPQTEEGVGNLQRQIGKTLRDMERTFGRMQATQYEVAEVSKGSTAGATSATGPLNRLVQLERTYNARSNLLGDQLAALVQANVPQPAGPDGTTPPPAGLRPEDRTVVEAYLQSRAKSVDLRDRYAKIEGLDKEAGDARTKLLNLLRAAESGSDTVAKQGAPLVAAAAAKAVEVEARRRVFVGNLARDAGLQTPEEAPYLAKLDDVGRRLADALSLEKAANTAAQREAARLSKFQAAQDEVTRYNRALDNAEDSKTPVEQRRPRRVLDPAQDPSAQEPIAAAAAERARVALAERLALQKELLKLLNQEEVQAKDIVGALRDQVNETQRLANELTVVAGNVAKAAKQKKEEEKDTRSPFQRFREELGNKVRTVSEYAIASGAVYTGFNTVRQGVSRAIDFEQDLAEIQGVFLKKTAAERTAIESGVLQAGLEFGVPLRQITGTAKTFAQTGAAPSEVLELTRGSLSATQGAGIAPELATELLIAVQEISKGTIAPANIIDRISRIEARNAVTAQDLATAIQRVGSLAAQLQPQSLGGVDAFDAVIASTTQIVEATRQTGAQAATGLKFILSRLTAPDIQKKLTEDFGIKLAANKEGTELRPILDILGDIAKLYTQLQTPDAEGNSQSKRAAELLGTVAGARQVNTAAALFADFGKVLETARESAFSYGDAQKRLQIQLDTLASKLVQTGNAFDQFMNQLLNNGVLGEASKLLVTGVGKGLTVASSYDGLPEITAGAALYGGTRLLKRTLPSASRAAAGAATAAGAGEVGAATASGLVASTAGLIPVAVGVATALIGLGLLSLVGSYFYKQYQTRQSLYEPQKFDREAFEQSELGQGYAKRATDLGTSPAALVSAVLRAEAQGRARTLAARNKDGSLRVPEGEAVFQPNGPVSNPTVYKTFYKEFTDALSDAVPALKEITDEATRQQAAMALLRDTVRRANVELDTRAATFESATEDLGASFSESLLKSVTAANNFFTGSNNGFNYKIGAPSARAAATGRLVASATPPTPESALRLTLDKATNLPALGRGLGSEVLNTILSDGKKLQDVALSMLESGKSIGQALDTIANEYFLASDPVRRGAGVQRLSDSLLPTLRTVFGKQLEVSGSTGDLAGTSAGGTFAKLFLDAYTTAARRLVEELKATKTDATRAKQTVQVLEDPRTRGAYEAALTGAIDKLNIRGLAKDQTLDVITRFMQQSAEIRDTAQLSRGRLTYDQDAERASAAQGLFRGVVGALSGLEAQLLRARARQAAVSQVSLEGFADFLASSDEGPLSKLDPAQQLAIFKDAATGPAAKNFDLEVKRLEQAVLEVRTNVDIFADLPKDIQAAIRTALAEGISGENFQATAAALKEASARILAQRTAVIQERQQRLNTLGVGFDRRANEGRAAYAEQQASLQTAQRLAELTNDLVQVFRLQREAAELTLKNARREAALTRERDLATLEEDKKGGLAPAEAEVRRAQIESAYQTQVQAATLEMQNQFRQLSADAAVRVQELARGQIEALREPWVAGIKSLFLDTRNLSREGLLNALEGIGGSLQDRVATIFTEKLVGQGGLFGSALDRLLGQEIFADQMLVRATDVTLVGADLAVPNVPALQVPELSGGVPPVGVPELPAALRPVEAPAAPAAASAAAAAVEAVVKKPEISKGLRGNFQSLQQPLPRVSNDTTAILARMTAKGPNKVYNQLEGTNEQFQKSMKAFIAHMEDLGHTVSIVETVRSQERQDMLYAKGPTVTKARHSKHTDGMAADIMIDGSYAKTSKHYNVTSAVAAQYGLKTIGTNDPGHLQLSPAMQQRAMRRPEAMPRGTQYLPKMSAPLFPRQPLVAPLEVRGGPTGPVDRFELPFPALRKPSFGAKLKGAGSATKQRIVESGILDQALFLGSSLGGAALGSKLGVRGGKNYAQSGASLGAGLGSLIGPWGTVAGVFLGGLIGGRIGRKGDQKPPETATLERIEANTRETVTTLENGVALRNLDQRLLNVPSSFQVPDYNPLPSFSSASQPTTTAVRNEWNVTIQVTEAANAQATARVVLNELQKQVRNGGTFTTPRR